MKLEYQGATYYAPDSDVAIVKSVLTVAIAKLVSIEVHEAKQALAAAQAEHDKIKALTDADLLAWAKAQPSNPAMAMEWAVAALDAATRAMKEAEKAAKVIK